MDQIPLWPVSSCGGPARRSRMACRAAWRQERRSSIARRRCTAANIGLLYSTCSRISCCLTRNNEVYNVHGRSALNGWAGATSGGWDADGESQAWNPAMSSKRQRHATCVVGRRGRRVRAMNKIATLRTNETAVRVATPPLVTLRGVDKVFANEVTALRGLDLDIQAGEFL